MMSRRMEWVRPTRLALCLSLLGVVLASPRLMAGDDTHPQDHDQAWKWMDEALNHAGIKNAKMENGVVIGENGNQSFAINLGAVTDAQIVSPAQKKGLVTEVEWHEFPNLKDSPGHLIWHSSFSLAAIHDSRRFQSALIFLAREAQTEAEAKAAAKLEAFRPKAAEWRQQAVKPEMPEEAHKHQVLAEHAFQGKDVNKAMLEYGLALQAFPYWPEGHYNLAILAGEIGGRTGWDAAVYHMKAYLELAPDAPDARAAKDSIIIWEDKLGK